MAAALAVMAIVLALVFEPPLRLLPLALALAATAVTFGILSLTGGSLTMASIAVLPVLIGLAVDYSIQFQARYREALEAGDAPAVAAGSASGRGGPVIGTAALATAAGIRCCCCRRFRWCAVSVFCSLSASLPRSSLR